MIKLPERLTLPAIRQLVRQLAAHANASENMRIERGGSETQDAIIPSSTGKVIKLRGFPKETGILAAPANFPLQPVKSGDDTVKFRYGTCHGDPVKIGGVEITGTFSDPANPELTITETGVIYIGVDLAPDTYAAENPVIDAAATLPADVDRSKAYHRLCDVTLTDGIITLGSPAHKGSLDIGSCGGVDNYWDLG